MDAVENPWSGIKISEIGVYIYTVVWNVKHLKQLVTSMTILPFYLFIRFGCFDETGKDIQKYTNLVTGTTDKQISLGLVWLMYG